MSKGYLPGTDSPQQAPVEGPKKHSGIQCQLLNPIDEKQAEHLLTNPDYWMQEKMDGRRLLIRKEGDTITGINRLGFITSVPEMIARSAASIKATSSSMAKLWAKPCTSSTSSPSAERT
jgi:bifunctional non-homologous end joining protein LigD